MSENNYSKEYIFKLLDDAEYRIIVPDSVSSLNDLFVTVTFNLGKEKIIKIVPVISIIDKKNKLRILKQNKKRGE
jgi:hypothetical protein